MEKKIDLYGENIKSGLQDVNNDLLSLLWDSHERSFYLPRINFSEEENHKINNLISWLRLDLISKKSWHINKSIKIRWHDLICVVKLDWHKELRFILDAVYSGTAFVFEYKSDFVELTHRRRNDKSSFSWSELLSIAEKVLRIDKKVPRYIWMNVSQYDVLIWALRNWFEIFGNDLLIDGLLGDSNYHIDKQNAYTVWKSSELRNCIICNETWKPARFLMRKVLEKNELIDI